MKSRRPRIRPYHWLSFALVRPEALMALWVYAVTLSMRPLMLTFGAGAWANATGASSPTRAKATTRTARLVLFIETLLNQVDDVRSCSVCFLTSRDTCDDGTAGETSVFPCHLPWRTTREKRPVRRGTTKH